MPLPRDPASENYLGQLASRLGGSQNGGLPPPVSIIIIIQNKLLQISLVLDSLLSGICAFIQGLRLYGPASDASGLMEVPGQIWLASPRSRGRQVSADTL